MYGQLIYNKGGKNIQCKTVSSKSRGGKTGQLQFERMKSEHSLTSHTKINSKWITDINVRPETIKLLEEGSRTV